MTNLNIIQAEDLVDNELSQADIDFLYKARAGIALSDVDEAVFRDLYDGGYIKVVYFTNVAAANGIQGVILSDDGTKLMNVLDNREKLTVNEKIDNSEEALQNEAEGGPVPETFDQTKVETFEKSDAVDDDGVFKDTPKKKTGK